MPEELDQAEEPSNKPTQGAGISIEVKDIFGLGKATENLKPAGVAILHAIAKVWAPAHTYLDSRAQGYAERHEIVADAKLVAKLENEIAVDPEIVLQIKSRLINKEIRRQKNISKTVGLALERSEQEVPDHAFDIDEDFMFEWIDGVQDVSNEAVQALWATILAQAPNRESGRVSKPAMILLKSFDANVAKNLQNFIELYDFCGHPSTRISPKVWSENGIEIDFSLLLDMGIISAHHGVKSATIHPFDVTQPITQNGMAIFRAIPTLSVWGFNHVASEIAECVPAFESKLSEQQVEQLLEINLLDLADDSNFNIRLLPRE